MMDHRKTFKYFLTPLLPATVTLLSAPRHLVSAKNSQKSWDYSMSKLLIGDWVTAMKP